MKASGRILLLAGLLSVLLPFLFASPAFADWSGEGPSGQGIMPQYRDDLPPNAECATLGYDYGFKIQEVTNGIYPFTSTYGELFPPGTPDDPANSVTIANFDGYHVDWSATLGIDAVVVKAGPGANVYVYNPEAIFDTGLHTPMSGSGRDDPGELREISHLTFCFDYFDNAPPEDSSITIAKGTDSKILQGTFGFQSTIEPTTFDLEIGQSLTFADLPPGGPYIFSEVVPEGIELTSIACEGAVESTVVIGEQGGFDPGDTGVTINLAPEENIVCTFIDDPIEPPPTGVGFAPSLLLGGLAAVGVSLVAIGGLLRVREAGLR